MSVTVRFARVPALVSIPLPAWLMVAWLRVTAAVVPIVTAGVPVLVLV